MPTIWYNQGYSVVRDAILLIREGAAAAGVTDLRLLASHQDFTATMLEAADLGFLEPAGLRTGEDGDEAYTRWCADRCRELDVDLFIAQFGQRAFAERLDLFPDTTRVILPGTPERLAQINDKGAFHQIASQAGIPMAWSMTVGNVADFDVAVQEILARGLQPCIKPREGVFGSGFWRLDEEHDLFETLMDSGHRRVSRSVMREAIAGANRPVRLLAMGYLPGPEWSLDCVCDDGRLVVGVARRKRGRVQELEIEGPIFDYAARAVETFCLSGQINVQFKSADEAGEDPRLLEINPRMSGGMARTRFAGVNLPWHHVVQLLGLPAPDERPEGGALIATEERGFTVRGMAREIGHV